MKSLMAITQLTDQNTMILGEINSTVSCHFKTAIFYTNGTIEELYPFCIPDEKKPPH